MNQTLSRVSTIFKERYGTQLSIDDSIGESKSRPHFNSQWKSSFVYSQTRKQVTFPIFNSRKELQAIATACPVDNKDAIVFDEMAQFLQLTVSEILELSSQSGAVERKESAILAAHSDHRKVVPLKTKKEDSNKSFEYKKINTQRKPDLRPVWIEGDDHSLNSQIAFAVHEWSSNWAFINAEEISDLIWEDQTGWNQFPQITIFIPNVQDLAPEKLAKLKENVEALSHFKGPKPLIIVTSQKTENAEMADAQSLFKVYEANPVNSAQVQAHFLLFHFEKTEAARGTFYCKESQEVFFLPFSLTPNKLH